VSAVATTDPHRRYLRKVGFARTTADRWEMTLSAG
jgi:hypothetical protein